MNARLFVLAIVFALIAALFMAVSAPVEENTFRMTLGGDCSADRATGDLYHIWDPYCITDQGNESATGSNDPLGDPAGNLPGESSYAPDGGQPNSPGDGPDPSDDENLKDSDGDSDPAGGKKLKDSDGDSNPAGGKKVKDPDGDSNPAGSEKLKDTDAGSKNQTANQGKPQKDTGKSPEKEYPNSASDNANSQGKHDCPAEKELAKDHDGPSDQDQKSDQVEIKGQEKK